MEKHFVVKELINGMEDSHMVSAVSIQDALVKRSNEHETMKRSVLPLYGGRVYTIKTISVMTLLEYLRLKQAQSDASKYLDLLSEESVV